MQFVEILAGGLALTLLVGSYVGVLLGSVVLSYWLFMGDDPWEGRFKHAGWCYGASAFVVVGVGWTLLTALWSLTGLFQ